MALQHVKQLLKHNVKNEHEEIRIVTCLSADRLEGAVVRVGYKNNRDNPTCGTISLEQINADQKVQLVCDLYGKYLSIELPSSKYLQLCEVLAFTGQCKGK